MSTDNITSPPTAEDIEEFRRFQAQAWPHGSYCSPETWPNGYLFYRLIRTAGYEGGYKAGYNENKERSDAWTAVISRIMCSPHFKQADTGLKCVLDTIDNLEKLANQHKLPIIPTKEFLNACEEEFSRGRYGPDFGSYYAIIRAILLRPAKTPEQLQREKDDAEDNDAWEASPKRGNWSGVQEAFAKEMFIAGRRSQRDAERAQKTGDC